MTTTEPRPADPREEGDERDPDLGSLETEDDPNLDREITTAFDWLGDPPDLWWEGNRVIDRADRTHIQRVKEMLSADGRGAMVEAALTLPVRQATPKLEKPEDDAGQTEFCEEALFAPLESGGMETPMATFLGQVANAMLVRRTFHEKVFTKNTEGKTIYKKLAWRPPESCDVWRDARSGDILGYRQYQYLDANGRPIQTDGSGWDKDDPNFRTVKRPYAFVYTHGMHRDPVNGISDLDVALWAHDMKMQIIKLWHAFCDGQATPRMAVYGADKIEVEKRAKAMAMLRGGGVAGFIRKGSDENIFDAIESSGTGSAVFQEMIRWLDNVANESIMAGHLGLTGGATEGRGSLSLSQDSSGLYQASRQGVAREISDAITADIVAPLVRINFGLDVSVPRFSFESVDTNKTNHIMELFTSFATAGSLKIPTEFVHLLMELVAQYLDLPMDKVETMIEEAEKAIEQGRLAQAEADRRMEAGEPAPGEIVDPEKAALADQVFKTGNKVNAAAAVVGAAQRAGAGARTATERQAEG